MPSLQFYMEGIIINMDGIQRLAKMLEGQKDKYLIMIVNYLMQKSELNQVFLNDEKNLKDMVQYIKDNAKKQANNGVAIIEDNVVFNWATEYFTKTNEELKIKKIEVKQQILPKEAEIKKAESEFGSIFDSDVQTDCKKENIQQISLFAA